MDKVSRYCQQNRTHNMDMCAWSVIIKRIVIFTTFRRHTDRYLLLNATLRRKFFGMIKEYTKKTGKTAINFATSVYPTKIRMRIQNQDMWTTNTQALDIRTSRQSQAPVSQYRQVRLPPLRNAQMAQVHLQ
jgi:hypothetical protein